MDVLRQEAEVSIPRFGVRSYGLFAIGVLGLVVGSLVLLPSE